MKPVRLTIQTTITLATFVLVAGPSLAEQSLKERCPYGDCVISTKKSPIDPNNFHKGIFVGNHKEPCESKSLRNGALSSVDELGQAIEVNLYGKDDRKPMREFKKSLEGIGLEADQIEALDNATGSLKVEGNKSGSAFIVNVDHLNPNRDYDVVLFSAHQVKSKDCKLFGDKITFHPKGAPKGGYKVESVTVGNECPYAENSPDGDWAVGVVRPRISKWHGGLGVASLPDDIVDEVVGQSKYPTGVVGIDEEKDIKVGSLGKMRDVVWKNGQQALYKHEIDLKKGPSGGPNFLVADGELLVIAIQSGDIESPDVPTYSSSRNFNYSQPIQGRLLKAIREAGQKGKFVSFTSHQFAKKPLPNRRAI